VKFQIGFGLLVEIICIRQAIPGCFCVNCEVNIFNSLLMGSVKLQTTAMALNVWTVSILCLLLTFQCVVLFSYPILAARTVGLSHSG